MEKLWIFRLGTFLCPIKYFRMSRYFFYFFILEGLVVAAAIVALMIVAMVTLVVIISFKMVEETDNIFSGELRTWDNDGWLPLGHAFYI